MKQQYFLSFATTLVSLVLFSASAIGQCVVTEDQDLPMCDDFHNRTGSSVSLDGNLLAVGVMRDPEQANSAGSVWTYDYDGNDWQCADKVMPPPGSASPQDFFGFSVDLDGDRMIVGVPNDDLPVGLVDAGSAYIFRYVPFVGWVLDEFLTAPTPEAGANFGYSVSLDGNVAVVGSPWEDHGGKIDSGAAHVFELSSGSWGFSQTLSEPTPEDSDGFGFSVSVWGDRILAGAPYDDHQGVNAGNATIFSYDGGIAFWIEEQTLLSNDTHTHKQFGASVALSETNAVIGAPFQTIVGFGEPGSAYIFDLDESEPAGSQWSQVIQLFAHDAEHTAKFGFSTAIYEDLVLVGAPAHGVDGAAYQFIDRGDGVWEEERKFIPSNGDGADSFGHAVTIGEEMALVGSPINDEPRTSAGGVYSFEGLRGLVLESNKDCVVAFDELELELRCGLIGSPAHIYITRYSDSSGTVPVFLHLVSGVFGPDGRFGLTIDVPPGWPGLPFDLTFQGFKVLEDPSGIPIGLVASNEVTVTFK